MPPIASLQNLDLSGFTRELPSPPASTQQLEQPLLPTRSPLLRFSAPYLAGTLPSSDTLTGFHLGGQIPQWRIPVPPPILTGNVATSTATTTVIAGSSTSTTTNLPAKSATTSVTTPTLSPAGQFTGVLTMAKAFIVLSVSVNAAARVRLYSTASAQTTDLSRPITQGAGFGTEQGIIGDMVLDTAPVVWQAIDMVGTNGNSPQTTTAYITVDNLGASSSAINVGIVFVPLQS